MNLTVPLIQIFKKPEDALKCIEDKSENEMMFWERWQVTELYLPTINDKGDLKDE